MPEQKDGREEDQANITLLAVKLCSENADARVQSLSPMCVCVNVCVCMCVCVCVCSFVCPEDVYLSTTMRLNSHRHPKEARVSNHTYTLTTFTML